MARKVIDIIYNLVRKRLAQQQPKGIVTRLPESAQIEQGMQEVFKTLRSGNINPVSADNLVKTEDDLAMLLNKIVQDNNRKTEAMKKADAGITRVFDKMRRGIPLNPDDQAALQGSGFKTALDNFKGFEPKVIQGGKDLTMKTRIGEIPYIESPTQTIMQGGKRVPVKIPKDAKDDLLKSFDNVMVRGEDTKYDADVLATDLAERRGFIKEGQDATDMDQKDYSKLYSEAYSFLTKSRFLNKPPRKPKKAKGGIVSAVKKLFKKSKSKKSGDKIYGVGGEEIDVADLKKSLGLDEATDKKSMEDLEKKLQMIIGKERTKHAKGGIAAAVKKLRKKFGKDIIQKGKAPKRNEKKKLQDLFREFNRKHKAGGGVAHMLGEPREEMAAGGPALRRLLQFLHQGADKPMKGSEGLKKMKLPKQVKFFAEKQGYNPDQIRINYLEQVLESLKADRKMIRNLDPDAPSAMTGKAKDEMELIADDIFKNQFLSTTQEGRFKGLTTEMIDSSIMELEGILKNLKTKGRKLNADGGRIGFADGGMSRRTFLKIMAALAAFPVVGKLAKTTKIAKGAKPIVTPTAEMPAHFPKLVEKIIREGQVVKKDFVKKTGDITTYKHPDRPDIELTIEGDGKRIQLDFETDQGMRGGYEFRKGVPDETVPNPPDEFIQGEVKYRMSPEGDYTKDFEEIIDTGTENLDQFAGIKKQKTSKSKVNLPESTDDFVQPGRIKDDLADGGLAGLLGE